MIRRAMLLSACVAVATFARACGPDFFPDVFVRTSRPDVPTRYVAGHLGILQTGFPSADLFVAFRYLNGGVLSADEQRAWSPTPSLAESYYATDSAQAADTETEPQISLNAWEAARAQYPNPPAKIDPNFSDKVTTQGFTYATSFPNCAADAFRTATATLQARSATWGKTSAALVNWLHGQDAVFAACSASVPAPEPAPAAAPLLLKQDRAYQSAAAHFYAREFDLAEQQFLATAADRDSPWRATSGYLAGRVLIRRSFLTMRDAQAPADYEVSTMQAAGRQFRAFLATDPPAPWRQAAEKELALIRIRTEPKLRTRELTELLAGPTEDRNYSQDAKDLLWVMSYSVPNALRADAELWDSTITEGNSTQMRRLSVEEAEQRAAAKCDKAYEDTATFRAVAPILDWTLTLRTLSKKNAEHALTEWKQHQSLPWLVASLMLAPDNATPDPALLQAAAEVPADSPAWETVTFHRARLQIAAGDFSAARKTIESLQDALDHLPSNQREPSSLNAVRGLRMRMADHKSLLYSSLPRTLLLAASETWASGNECAEVMKQPADWHHCIQPGKDELDLDGARLLNEQAPLSVWMEAAHADTVPQPLRQAIAMQGWTRAALLHDTADATFFVPLLPQPIQKELSSKNSLAPWMELVRNPGLQPFVDPGVQRAYSYDFVESYRLNWCYNPASYAKPAHNSSALTEQDEKLGQAQFQQLSSIRAVSVGEQLMQAVQANPSDPQAPEALYLILRMIRYGCDPVKEPGAPPDFSMADLRPDLQTGERLLRLRRDAARLMRHYYANSAWTKKAAPFVGEVHPPKPDEVRTPSTQNR